MRSFIPRLVRLSAPLALVFFGSLAQASLVLDLTSHNNASCVCGDTNGTTGGWAFTVNSAIRIDGLGVWDAGSDGLGTTPPVKAALWTSAGTLLASVTVTDSSTVVASADPSGRWLFETIPTLTLDRGNYVIGALLYNGLSSYVIGRAAPIAQISGISGRYGRVDDGLMPPGFPGAAMYGPTMRLAPAATVPEPGSLLLVAAAGLALLATRRRAA
ncbi:MAG: PEP-CTERM sorting domain-containing protein [Rubrivivax sp.]|nr:PEP-CTERM sorting domain-containing protein [Rubrivivax sp.]